MGEWIVVHPPSPRPVSDGSYRLPSSFSGDKAKCKQCGSVVDVAAQRSAASAPKAAPAAEEKRGLLGSLRSFIKKD